MTHERCCEWCHKKMSLKGTRDNTMVFFCSRPCVDAHQLFWLHYSDEEINRREHYKILTRGTGEDDEEVKKLPP